MTTTGMDVDYRIELDTFSGPLDLLLLLVRRHEIDLNDIPVAELTDQYLHYLEQLERINVDTAGEFLVMAATLLEIKSAMLIPRPELADDEKSDAEGEPFDPRFELVQQLLTYKRFKDAALELDDRRDQWQARYAHRPGREIGDGAADESDVEQMEFDLEDVHILDLCRAYARIAESIGQGPGGHEVVYDDTPVALHAEDIMDRLKRDGPMTLQSIYMGRDSRAERIGLFLAMLELVRNRHVRFEQEDLHSLIRIEPISDEEQQRFAALDDAERNWQDPETGTVQYDWPSEEARLLAKRRAERRFEKLKEHESAKNNSNDENLIIVDDDEATES